MGGGAACTTYFGRRMMPFFGLSMSRRSVCWSSGLGAGAGFGGAYFGMLSTRALARSDDWIRRGSPWPSSSAGGTLTAGSGAAADGVKTGEVVVSSGTAGLAGGVGADCARAAIAARAKVTVRRASDGWGRGMRISLETWGGRGFPSITKQRPLPADNLLKHHS